MPTQVIVKTTTILLGKAIDKTSGFIEWKNCELNFSQNFIIEPFLTNNRFGNFQNDHRNENKMLICTKHISKKAYGFQVSQIFMPTPPTLLQGHRE